MNDKEQFSIFWHKIDWVLSKYLGVETLFSELQFNYRCLLSGRFKIFCSSSILKSSIQDPTFHFTGTTLEGAEGAESPPGIWGFRKENRKRNRQSITNSPPGIKILT